MEICMADTPVSEPPIIISNREQLLYTLTEAAEIEHNLMCCYLYAAWSLKTEPDDDVDAETRAEIAKWSRAIIDIAIDEMTHLALVANLMNAVGGVAHFGRPNFPISPGMLPAGLVVRLAPFNADTLQHFIFLERPEGSDEPDAESFVCAQAYERGQHGLKLTPAAQDYLTVGHLYRSVEAGLKALVEQHGETHVFLGDPALQVGPDTVRLDGLIAITNLETACQALETIVEQGEGAQAHSDTCHYARFVAIREAMKARPDLKPAHAAATNPVMRHPPFPEGRVWVSREDARGVIDLGNAAYNHMLRCLMQGFASTDPDEKKLMVNTAIDLMMAVVPLGQELARMKANDEDDCNAGLSFATLRNPGVPKSHPNVIRGLGLRARELAEGARALPPRPRIARAAAALQTVSETLLKAAGEPVALTPIEAPAPAPVPPQSHTVIDSKPAPAPEIVDGRDLTLVVDMHRCIHSRYCVTGAPQTFIANVEGPWLHPDESEAGLLVRIAHDCPSGAIGYRGKNGVADEAAPKVNMLRVRENGPNAIHAPLIVAGKPDGFRATFCRCGQSKNKPYCDGSHHEAGFTASGEPETISLDPIAVRDGPLHVDPQKNGPLKVTGNLEICAGTGRVVKRVDQAMLCRCGHSKHKPFCDGSHRAAGFEADGV
jgi:CDGSH-type Zn-finger protein/uncharacterized Fe-S cluster protein YjdI